MKQTIARILIFCLFITGLNIFGSASADAQSGGFSYTVLEDGTASITGCSLRGDIVIPSILDGYTVTNLKAKLFYGRGSITSVSIPATVTGFGTDPEDNRWDYVFSYCSNLKSITVDAENPVFSSKDGVLYTQNGKTLINYPCNKDGEVFHVPEEVTTLCCTSFASNNNLRKLYLDGDDTWWFTYTFAYCGKLTVYYKPGARTETKVKQEIEERRSHESNSSRPVFLNVEESEPEVTGWVESNAGWTYIKEDGTKATGWLSNGSEWYFMNADGLMQTGWVSDGNDWYYMKSSGAMATGWVQSGNDWYFMKPSGAMATGWLQSGNDWYYMKPSGAMATGWVQSGNDWYYMKSSGAMALGWQEIGGTWYYFKDSGAMKTGWFEDKKAEAQLPADRKRAIWYWFDNSGTMATGWKEIDGQWEMFDEKTGEWLYTWQGE